MMKLEDETVDDDSLLGEPFHQLFDHRQLVPDHGRHDDDDQWLIEGKAWFWSVVRAEDWVASKYFCWSRLFRAIQQRDLAVPFFVGEWMMLYV